MKTRSDDTQSTFERNFNPRFTPKHERWQILHLSRSVAERTRRKAQLAHALLHACRKGTGGPVLLWSVK